MIRGLILLANYFEDIEAIATIDLLRRAKIIIDTVSIEENLMVESQSGITVKCDYQYRDIIISKYDFLIIPGGQAVAKTHFNSFTTKEIIEDFMSRKSLIAMICAAPMILDQMGYLKDRQFTCFPNEQITPLSHPLLSNQNVVVDGNIITAKAAGSTFEFAYRIIEYLTDYVTAQQVLDSVYYKN